MAIANVNSQQISQSGIHPNQNTQVRPQQGGLFKNQPQPAQSQSAGEQRGKEALDSIDRLLNRVMDELNKSDAINKTAKIIEQARDTKITPNLAKDLQGLSAILDADTEIMQNPTLKELALKLKEFLRPIADLKAATLNDQIKSSGIMLEANLKEALSAQKLPSSVQKLLSDIKNLSNQALLNEIVNLANDETLDTKGSFSKLNSILADAKAHSVATLNSSPIKGLLSGLNKLDDMAKFLDKQSFNIAEKGANLSGESIKSQMSKIGETIKSLISGMERFSSEKLNQSTAFSSNLREFAKISKEILGTLDGLDKIGSQMELVKTYTTATQGEGSLQDKLQSAARRLSQSLNFIDQTATNAKTNLDELKTIIKQLHVASNDGSQVENKSSADIAKTLSNDMKSTLLSLQDKSAGLNNSQQISQMASKMISQIELHQIVSSLSGGVQTYLPYVWDDVDNAKVAFKRGKKDKYYAQIDLNFKNFGQINVMTTLSEKRYIDITIATQRDEFKSLITENQKELKQAINSVGLMVSGFSIKTMPKDEIKRRFKDFSGLEMGYDVRA
ncbi:flagellar hook-length control protein FliK [Campylobacter sp. 9BO]|uniref:flagellar hook-length control protein FliK n=1 Tax=Campylobacter sp. 9BO TaxID=3424759 RepID=UPI003D32D0A3